MIIVNSLKLSLPYLVAIIFLSLILSGCGPRNIVTKNAESTDSKTRIKIHGNSGFWASDFIWIWELDQYFVATYDTVESTPGWHTVTYCTYEWNIPPFWTCMTGGTVRFFAESGHQYKFKYHFLMPGCIELFDTTTNKRIAEDCPVTNKPFGKDLIHE